MKDIISRRSALSLISGVAILLTSRTAMSANEEHLVIVKDFKFVTAEITIKRGDSIRWENREKRQYHSVWFEALDVEEPDYIFPDESYSREFNQLGDFPYRCGPHPKMTGIVHVVD